jgi:hypothetical protein
MTLPSVSPKVKMHSSVCCSFVCHILSINNNMSICCLHPNLMLSAVTHYALLSHLLSIWLPRIISTCVNVVVVISSYSYVQLLTVPAIECAFFSFPIVTIVKIYSSI